jgi:hypothetical protein
LALGCVETGQKTRQPAALQRRGALNELIQHINVFSRERRILRQIRDRGHPLLLEIRCNWARLGVLRGPVEAS